MLELLVCGYRSGKYRDTSRSYSPDRSNWLTSNVNTVFSFVSVETDYKRALLCSRRVLELTLNELD